MHIRNKGFISISNLCLYGYIFVDYGVHAIHDKTGELSKKKFII